MKFNYKVEVSGCGYTTCGNGAELDILIMKELRDIDLKTVTITLEPIHYKYKEVCTRCGLLEGDHRASDQACPHPRRFELNQPLYLEHQFFKADTLEASSV